ncbi:hypothetical protein BCR34DRAFT_582990 [Clohesyomyces aquaticus]|uniref:Uncharacterized protein n=1 Tax=Clohesyomyces aquaticus TaxID=1231657 RepID=A0A1Y2A7Q1_9PLEO|nr:hypothetical protein BCR34DRAFT_582990 [Clohesyomyces aquaticus]
MEYGVQQINPYHPPRMSGFFDAPVSYVQAGPEPSSWAWMLTNLRIQGEYLQDLLCKTTLTLHALRDKYNRTQRALDSNPTPRKKKKRLQQVKWRTDKTIKTCENEERVILDSLQLCSDNIRALEIIINPCDTFSAMYEYDSSTFQGTYTNNTTPATTDMDWIGWATEGDTSPLQRRCEQPVIMDDVPPEVPRMDLGNVVKLKIPAPPRARHSSPDPVSVLSWAPPNTACPPYMHSMLSPEAALFEPSITHYPPVYPSVEPYSAKDMDDKGSKVDKLSISGLLASKRVQRLQSRRRFSDAAVNHVFERLASRRPSVDRTRDTMSWGPDSTRTPTSAPAPRRVVQVNVKRERGNSF